VRSSDRTELIVDAGAGWIIVLARRCRSLRPSAYPMTRKLGMSVAISTPAFGGAPAGVALYGAELQR